MANLSNFVHRSSPPQPATGSPSLESLEFSIQDVIKLSEKRRRWRTLFAAPIQTNRNRLDTSAPWQTQLVAFLESTPAHVVTIILLLMDLTITVLELSSSLISCSLSANHKKGAKEVLYFHWVGIAILSLLSAKTVALAVGLGGLFLRQPGCIVDGVVAVVALVLEVVAERKGGGVIIVASLWRLVRVVESVFELSDDAIEGKIEAIVLELERVEEETRREKEQELR
ncbi:uncharacterized protein LOC111018597 [Momordica charantia]|uniref:Uncharacterized protein LOC111018597 n=1 Tax=Momordica charantia TaxID=3673 RepID=A0A6J1D8I2_MOMCH|nr:uncharacterized protein LOC111018597 [Momordica charantia]